MFNNNNYKISNYNNNSKREQFKIKKLKYLNNKYNKLFISHNFNHKTHFSNKFLNISIVYL